MRDPDTESAMFQIHNGLNGSLDAYFGYGDKKTNNMTIANRVGNINVSTANGGEFRLSNSRLILDSYSNAEPSGSFFEFRNWGMPEGNRRTVMDVMDNKGWHFYTQRMDDDNIEFAVAGTLTCANRFLVQNNGIGVGVHSVLGGHSIAIGDNDTGFKQNGDGILDVYANSQQVFRWQHDKVESFKTFYISGPDLVMFRNGRRHIQHHNGTNIDGYIWRDPNGGLNINNGTNPGSWSFGTNSELFGSGNANFNDVHIRSDRRLKINLEEMEDGAIDKVNKLTVYSYDKVRSLKDREVVAREVGIIAQDLQEILPEAVISSRSESQDESESVLSISNSAVNALLIKAVQEMSKRIEYLESKLK
ncbi:hypothetical protein DLC15_22705 [Salmonella enterica subsp. enterica serovar Telelkebir]|nr:hypothetical protein [Salmonella enterica subsp. enterica serovar Telelkebir]